MVAHAIIPARQVFERLGQEEPEFETSLGLQREFEASLNYTRSCLTPHPDKNNQIFAAKRP